MAGNKWVNGVEKKPYLLAKIARWWFQTLALAQGSYQE